MNFIGGIKYIEITPELIRVCKKANRNYLTQLKENREKKAQNEKTTQKDELKKEIDAKKQEIKQTEDSIKHWKVEITKTLKLAADPDKTKIVNPEILISRLQTFHETVGSKEDALPKLQEELENLRSSVRILI